ncbi:MAG: hypothetical protein ACO1RT_01380 [Planctomycetaceae bacterium]
MPHAPHRDHWLGAIAVIALLVSTATGSAYAMLGISIAALVLLTIFGRRRIGSGALLIALVAAVTAALIAMFMAAR